MTKETTRQQRRIAAIFGDDRFVADATDLDAQRAHVDLFDLVQERQRQAAAGNENALAAETGPDQGDVARRLAVEAVEEHHRDRHHDDGDGNAQYPAEDNHTHLTALPGRFEK